jgi:hypothetical protein
VRDFDERRLDVFQARLLHFGGRPLDGSFERGGPTEAIPDAVAKILQPLQSFWVMQGCIDELLSRLTILLFDGTWLGGNEGAGHENERQRSEHLINLAGSPEKSRAGE